ncbi:MAG: UDPGP type 1 family protein [Lachnospiraceae bacterium]|nr:UDPGP type 1 family protein [Lachnospiraceae bacterium]
MTHREALEKLKKYGQEHVLRFFDELSESGQAELLAQIEETDFSVLSEDTDGGKKDERVITPIKVLQLPQIEEKKEEYRAKGLEAIRTGKLGAVLLAGGMGTRLGSSDPKGMYDIGLTKHVYIFQRLIENLQDVVKTAGCPIHLFVMTSEKNHEATVSFFKEKEYFGYPADHVHFFRQEMVPATDYDGKVYMESKSRIATSPNGNGGWFTSLQSAGLTDIVDKEGIEYINIFAVDNVLQRIADPVFFGAVLESGSECGSKVVKKNAPDEGVGVMCLKDGHPSIVEYYELTEELMEAKDENGEPAYNFGVILNYLFSVKALKRIVNDRMPLHIVEKKIPHIDENGDLIKPEEPNGHKYEKLVLDMVEMMDSGVPFEVVREKEFAPIKNKTGKDSVESARELLKQNGFEL